jgi:hypothetical protein
MADTNGLNELERVLRGTIKELRENPHIIPQYVTLVERELREKARVLLAIPECPVHGPGCVPHAVEWIEAQKRRESESMTQNGQSNGGYIDDRGRDAYLVKQTAAPYAQDSGNMSAVDPNTLERIVRWEGKDTDPVALWPPSRIKGVSVTANRGGYVTAPKVEYDRREFDRHMKVSRTLYARTFLRLALGHGAECVKNAGLALSDVYWLVRSLVRGR